MIGNDNADEHEKRLRAMKYRGGYEDFKQQCQWRFQSWLDSVLNGEAGSLHKLEVEGVLVVRDDGDYVPEVRFKVTHPLTLRARSL